MPDDQDDQVPAGVDPAVPTAARIYDYLLGGQDNFAADRAAAQRLAELSPEIGQVARANRAFLGRAVRFLAAEAGIRQFLDLGAGLPTNGNVHQVAEAAVAGTRVVYVDNDPSVLAHAQALTSGDRTAVIQSDLRDPAAILAHPDTGRLIDLTQPLAILFVAVLHFVPDPDVRQAVTAFTRAAAPGSYLVLSHGCSDPDPDAAAASAARYTAGAYSAYPRSRSGILAFYAGFDLIDPGLVPVHQWRPGPGDPPTRGRSGCSALWAGSGQLSRRQEEAGMTGESLDQAAEEQPAFATNVAHVARVYNYWLGGSANYPADREAAERAIAAYPDLPVSARANRAFLARAVRWLTRDAGLRQFLDIGTGIPAPDNTHEVAQAIAPETRVVYADHDPLVLDYARSLLTSSAEGATDYLQADLRDPAGILSGAARTLDFSQPVGVVLMAVLQFISDGEGVHGIVTQLLDAVPPGSYLVLSHPASDIDADKMIEMAKRLNQLMSQRVDLRNQAEVTRFFDGLELVHPGVVRIPEWRPDAPEDTATPATMWGGVARKP